MEVIGFMFLNDKNLLLSDYRDELVRLYGYDVRLAEDIAMTAQSIEEYFGSEYGQVILDAIRNTKVVLVDGYRKNGVRETIGDVLAREGLSQEALEAMRESDVRNMEGLYVEEPHIVHGSDGYRIDAVQKVAVINSPYVENSENFLALLSRELMNAVKSHLNAYSIDGDVLTIRHGVAVKVERLYSRDGEVGREKIEEYGYGLENGIANYEKMGLVREAYKDDYDLRTHTLSVLAAGYALGGLKLEEIIRQVQITKDMSGFEELIATHTGMDLKSFLQVFDTLYALERKSIVARSGDKQAADEAQSALEDYYKNQVASLMTTMRTSMKIGLSEEELSMQDSGATL